MIRNWSIAYIGNICGCLLIDVAWQSQATCRNRVDSAWQRQCHRQPRLWPDTPACSPEAHRTGGRVAASTDSTDSVVSQWTQGNAPWHLNQRAPNVRPVRATFGVFHLAKRAKGSDTDVQTVEKRCKNDKLGKKSETLMKIEENWNEHLLNFRTWHKLHRLPVNHPEIHSHCKVVLSYGFAVKRTFLRQKQPHFMQLGPLEPLDGPHLKAITPLSQKRL